jgi:hypothetical protein
MRISHILNGVEKKRLGLCFSNSGSLRLRDVERRLQNCHTNFARIENLSMLLSWRLIHISRKMQILNFV